MPYGRHCAAFSLLVAIVPRSFQVNAKVTNKNSLKFVEKILN